MSAAIPDEDTRRIAELEDDIAAIRKERVTANETLRATRMFAEKEDGFATEAEEQKLEAILNAQYGQLAALDSEVSLTAAEIQVKATEATAMRDAQSQADAEARGVLARQEAKKISNTFKPTSVRRPRAFAVGSRRSAP